jgi:Flp pilus assembly protein TadD
MRWFAEAIKPGPSLPQAYVDRGSAYLQWGDTAGAQADATKATHLSPHHADAWKLWGDVLAKQGHGKEALAKYDEALKYAPNWKQLQEAREAAANQKT